MFIKNGDLLKQHFIKLSLRVDGEATATTHLMINRAHIVAYYRKEGQETSVDTMLGGFTVCEDPETITTLLRET